MTTRADRQRARALGKKGGASTSPAKVAAARANLAKARAARKKAGLAAFLGTGEVFSAEDVRRKLAEYDAKHGPMEYVIVTGYCEATSGCCLDIGHDGPCFVPAGGTK